MQAMIDKDFWKSKTLWFNLLAGVLIVAEMLGYSDFVADDAWLALVTAVANFVLRWVTSQPVALRAKS